MPLLFWLKKKYRPFIYQSLKGSFLTIIFIYALTGIYSLCFQGRVILIKPLLDSQITQKDAMPLIIKLALGVLVLSCLVALFGYLVEYLRQSFVLKVSAKVRMNLFNEILNTNYTFFTNKKMGDFLNHLTVDFGYVNFIYQYLVGGFAMSILMIIASFLVAAYISLPLTILVFIITPAIYYLIYKLTKKIKKRRTEALESFTYILDNISEVLHNLKIIKLFGLSERESSLFSKVYTEYLAKEQKVLRAKALTRGAIELLYGVGFSALFVVAGYLLTNKLFGLTVGGFTAFLVNIVTLNKPVRNFLDAYQVLLEAYAALDRVLKVYEYPKDKKLTDSKQIDINNICLKNIGFQYDSRFVLKDINFDMKIGDIVWIKGPSGAGKTTLMDILCGFLKPTEGSIIINGNQIENIEIENFRNNITLIPNETILFNTTILENILCVKPDASEEEIQNAINSSYVSEFLDKVESGLEFRVGPMGTRLSSGQRQRVALARAFLRNTNIYIFDEPFSNLDPLSEELIEKSISKLSPGKIIVIASHKVPKNLPLTKTVELKDGKICSISTD